MLEGFIIMVYPKNPVTLHDVSREAKVCLNTAAKVLAGQAKIARISNKTAERVRKAAEKLGYVPNIMARNLRAKNSRNIAVFISDMTDYIYTESCHRIVEKLYVNDYFPIVSIAEIGLELCFQQWLQNRIEGVILCGTTKLINSDFIDRLHHHHILPVIAGCAFHDPEAPLLRSLSVSIITTDNHLGIQLVIHHLHKQGKQRIAFITGPYWQADAYERKSSYLQLIQSFQTPLIADPDSALAPWQRGYEGAAELLAGGQSLDAIIAYDDQVAAGAIQLLLQKEVKIPRDIAVTGFDNTPVAEFLSPTLTTVKQAFEVISQKVVDLMAGKLHTNSPVEQVRVAPSLVIRDST